MAPFCQACRFRHSKPSSACEKVLQRAVIDHFSAVIGQKDTTQGLIQCRYTYASQCRPRPIPISTGLPNRWDTPIAHDPPALCTWINEDGPDVVGMLQLALKLSPVTAQH